MEHVTEVSIDEALAEIAHRRKQARRAGDRAAFTVLDKQLDKLLRLKFAAMHSPDR